MVTSSGWAQGLSSIHGLLSEDIGARGEGTCPPLEMTGVCWGPAGCQTQVGRAEGEGGVVPLKPTPRAHAPTFLITEFFVLVEIFYICIIQDRGPWPHVTGAPELYVVCFIHSSA